MKIKTKLGRVVLLVKDPDEAFTFYEKNFFCTKLHDSTSPEGRRYLHVAFSNDKNLGMWFLKAEAAEQEAQIGHQTAGEPTLVIYTNEILQLYQHVKGNGVSIVEPLVISQNAKFFHCLDLYGNRLTVVELG